MAISLFKWKNVPSTDTPIDAAGLNGIEARGGEYTDIEIAKLAASVAAEIALTGGNIEAVQKSLEEGFTAALALKQDKSTAATDSELAAVKSALEEALGDKQPLDADLTALAALSTKAFGRSLLEANDAAAGRTALGLGSAATQASDAFFPIHSPLEFGAVGDGVTDDTVAINAAYAKVAESGGTLHFAPKPYKVSGEGFLMNANARVLCHGPGATLEPTQNSTAITVDPGVSGNTAVGAVVSDLRLKGTGSKTQTLLKLRNAERHCFRDMRFDNGLNAILISNDGVGGYNEDNQWENIYVNGSTNGIKYERINGAGPSFEENTFFHVSLSGCKTGVYIGTGCDQRAVKYYALKIWTTGEQTGIFSDTSLQDMVADIQFEALSGTGNVVWQLGENTTAQDEAHLQLSFLGIWANPKFVLHEKLTLPLSYHRGNFRYMGGFIGGQAFKLRGEGDTQDRARISSTSLQFGPGGSTAPDTKLTRRTDADWESNKDIYVNGVKLTKGNRTAPPPEAFGWKAMLIDPIQAASGSLPGSTGVLHASMLYLEMPTTITELAAIMTVVATGASNCYLGLFDVEGKQIAKSADLSAGFGATGLKKSGALTVASEKSLSELSGWVICALLLGAGSGSNWAKTAGTQSAIAAVAGREHRGFISGAGLTAIPASITMASVTDIASPLWFGLL